MSDLLKDQKIHYIVKDYRRMLEMHDKLVKACKDASEAIKSRDMRILSLEARLTKDEANYKMALNYIQRVKDQLCSIECRARKAQEMLTGLTEVLKPSNNDNNGTSNTNV